MEENISNRCPKTLKPEIDHHITRLVIGFIALLLPVLTSIFATEDLKSISAAYLEHGIASDIFVGFLFAIAALLLSYNGKTICELVLSKVAAIAAIGVAVVPCKCEQPICKVNGDTAFNIFDNLHGAYALIMFLILAYFCYAFYQSAKNKVAKNKENKHSAKLRMRIYATSGCLILLSITTLLIDMLTECPTFQLMEERLVFYLETLALIAFGISWLTASLTVPLVAHHSERCKVIPKSSPSTNQK